MLGKFFNSFFDGKATAGSAFQVAKYISDYVGMLMRLAFVVLIERLMWAMFEKGAFGDNTYWFSIAVIYVSAGILWGLFFALTFSIFNITYRCVVEAFDELTGFTSSGNGLGWLFFLMVRIFLGVVIALYGGLIVMAASTATQNIVKYLGAAPA